MASENPDDKKELDPKDGSKKPPRLYKGVYKKKGSDKWFAQCWIGRGSVHLGTFETDLEAALAYDKKCRELDRPERTLNFPNLNASSPATESTLPIANPEAGGLQTSGPSGSSSANIGRGKKRQQISISQSEIDEALPYHQAKKREFEAKNREFARTNAVSMPATMSTLPVATSSVSGIAIGSESANTSGVKPAVTESAGNAGGRVQDLEDSEDSFFLIDEVKTFVDQVLDGVEKRGKLGTDRQRL